MSDMRSNSSGCDVVDLPPEGGGPAVLDADPNLAHSFQARRLDENLHFGRAWHRYHYRYQPRATGALRILDASLDDGRAAAESALLNPGARVVALAASPSSLEIAQEQAREFGVEAQVECQLQDPAETPPASWGSFDFIICRFGLRSWRHPDGCLAALARSLDPSGLIYLTLPARSDRRAEGALLKAIHALCPAEDPSAEDIAHERISIGLEILLNLHADHPIRVRLKDVGLDQDPEKFVADALDQSRDWTFEEASALFTHAGLRLLYAATPWRWRPDRVFSADSLPDPLRSRLENLPLSSVGALVDALDPGLLQGEYRLYGCHREHEPITPEWVASRRAHPEDFDHVIPHLSGLMLSAAQAPSDQSHRFLYRTVSGALGELDRWSSLILNSVDGTTTCGEIARSLASKTRASDHDDTRQDRWIDLADCGLILLEPPRKP